MFSRVATQFLENLCGFMLMPEKEYFIIAWKMSLLNVEKHGRSDK